MFKFKIPIRLIIAGSSGSGKSSLLSEILSERDKYFDKEIHKIIYCAKYRTSIPHKLQNDKSIIFHEGVPTNEMIENEGGDHILFCLDDLLESAFASDIVSQMFTTGRNINISVILLTQNLFPRYKNSRNISLNANYLIIFRNLRDASSISHLARQVCPSQSKAFSDLFINNINKPYSYLLLDFTPTTPDVFRYRENILSECPTIYVDEAELRNVSKRNDPASSVSEYIIELPEF